MNKKKILILGSTGSIGKSTLNVLGNYKNKIEILGLSTNKNFRKLHKQSKLFNVKNLIINDPDHFFKAKKFFKFKKIKLFQNVSEFLKKNKKKIDLTIIGISGLEGLEPTLKLIPLSKNLASANKESIICGWEFIKKKLLKYNTNFIPIDSEHFSIWSLLNSDKDKISKIYLTASGGPFLNSPVNKLKKIKIIIHPKSLIHAIVVFNNGLIKILMHDTSMEIPIFNIIFKNEKINFYKKTELKFENLNGTNFIKPNNKKFPYIDILKKYKIKGTFFEVILVTINDELVKLFLNKKISFIKMQDLLLKTLNKRVFSKYYDKYPTRINDIYKMVNKVKIYLSENE